ncbi:MAG TPA: transglutaminase domain-containing protein [Terriglobales bacterium]|nr:transglutaminase domain-containing protein [Terriglobales bacterium]
MVCLVAVTVAVTVGAGRPRPVLAAPPQPTGALPAVLAATAPSSATALVRTAQPYMVDARTLPAAAAKFTDAGVVELYHLRYEQVMPSGLSALVVQRVFQIRNAEAADLFALDDLWYDSSRTVFQLQYAHVLRHGQVLNGSDRGNLNPGATGNQPRWVSLPRLRAGDRIDVVYLLLPRQSRDWSVLAGHFIGNLFAFRDSFPTAQARYVLASRQPVTFGQMALPPPSTGHDLEGSPIWSWEAVDLPAFLRQPGGPSITDSSPFVQVSGFGSWAAMATWYSGLLAERARMAPAFQQQLLRLAQPLPAHSTLTPAATRAEVDRVWGYLATHLDYRGNESGVHAYVPAPVVKVFADQRGDCKDGALLLTTWLRAEGIEADVALVRTPVMGRLAGAADGGGAAATVAAFDHALVYIPLTGQWIDTTAPGLVGSELPASDQNSLALIIRAGQRSLVHVPAAPAAANFTRRSVRLTPAGQGWYQAAGEIEVHGADAPALRERYAVAAQRPAALQAWLGSYFPKVQVDSVAVEGVAPARDTVRVSFTAKIHPQHLTVAWLQRHYANLMASEVARQESLELPLRWQLDESWSLRLTGADPCAAVAPSPAVHRDSPFGSLAIAVDCDAGWLRVDSRVVQPTERVAATQYGAFRTFWQCVDADLNAPLPLAPAGRLVVLTADTRR